MSRKLLKTTTLMNREDASQKLHELADKMADGEITLSSVNDSITLNPADQVEFELDVEEEDGDISIEIEVEWPENPENEEIEIN